jgi:hypothetical protein
MYSIGNLPSLCTKSIAFLDWLATIEGSFWISPRLPSPSSICWRKVKSFFGMQAVMKHSKPWKICWPCLLCWHNRTPQSPLMSIVMPLVLGSVVFSCKKAVWLPILLDNYSVRKSTIWHMILSWLPLSLLCGCGHIIFLGIVIPTLMPKPSTHRMYTQDQLFHTFRQKVLTDDRMPWIKYNCYIDKVSKDWDDSQAKRNRGRFHNSTGMTIGATRSLELLVKEF